MIRIYISEILGKRKMSRKQLSDLSGVGLSTISKLYYEDVKLISIDNLNKICNTLKCPLSDIIEHFPDEQEKS